MYRSVLKACNDTRRDALARAKRGLESTSDSVVSTLVKFGSLDEAVHVCQRFPQRNVLSWTAVISGYRKAGKYEEALGLYQYMREQGVEPNKYTLVSVLKACGSTTNLTQGKRIHADALKYGCGSDLYVGTCLIDMYAKCGSTVDAQTVFDMIPQPDVVSWRAIVAAYVQQGQSEKTLRLYQQMQEEGVNADARIFVMVLQACGSVAEKQNFSLIHGYRLKVDCLQTGLAIHAEAWRTGCDSDVFVGSTLISMYAKCGANIFAQQVFVGMSERNIVPWNALLAGYAVQGHADKVWQLYQHMKEELVSPDARTLVSVLQACGSLADKDTPLLVGGQSVRMESLRKGKIMHAQAHKCGCASDVFVGSALVSMYAKCGSIMDAQLVVGSLPCRNVVLWNALLTGYAHQGQGEKSMNLYHQMQEELVSPDDRTFVTVLQACGSSAEKEDVVPLDGQTLRVKSLHEGKAIHAHARRKGFELDTYVGNSLVTMYAKCGSILDAQSVFDGLLRRDVVSWNAMLTGYIREGQGKKTLQLYNEMREHGVSPDERTLVSVLQACACAAEGEDMSAVGRESRRLETLDLVRRVHVDAQDRHYDSDAFFGNTLISIYAKCGNIVEAQRVFDGMSHRDIVLWNSMLVSYDQQGEYEKALDLYHQMRWEAVSPDERTFINLFHVCGNLAGKEDVVHVDGQVVRVEALQKGRALHDEAQRRGHGSDVLVHTALITMYTKCGSIVNAQSVFDELSQQTEASWSSILLAYAQQGSWDKVVQLYSEMQEGGVSPKDRTIVTVLQACGNLAEKEEIVLVDEQLLRVEALNIGKEIHAEAQKSGFQADVFVGKALISMYGKCGSIVDAEHVFDGLLWQQDVVSWSVMLAACVQQGQAEQAFQLYQRMQEAGVTPDDRVFVSLLQACGNLARQEEMVLINGQALKVEALQKGNAIYADLRRIGYETNVFICNTLISMYAKCGSLMDARDVFNGLSHRTVVTWNAMIAGYAEQGQGEMALELYDLMRQEVVSPDNWNFVSALQACGSVAETEEATLIDGHLLRLKSLQKGRAIHQDACVRGHVSDLFVCTALVSMYGKCGSIADAQLVFDSLSQRSVEWWNAMLGAYVQQGELDQALLLYGQMLEEGTSPDDTSYARILRLCGNTGALNMCMQIHRNLVSTGHDLGLIVAPSLISAYAKCSSLVDAQDVFNQLPQPDVASWNALTAGYARQGDFETSLQCYEKMQLTGVKPNEVTFLTLLSACSHAGMVDRGVEYFESMSKDHGITPEMDHYVTMVDLLGRAGCFTKLEQLLATMPMQPNPAIWLSLLSACRKHGNVVLGKHAFDCAVHLQPTNAAPYIVMRNIYAHAGMWDKARKVDAMRLEAGARKKPGQSWIEHGQGVHAFIVGKGKHRQQEQIHDLSGILSEKVKP